MKINVFQSVIFDLDGVVTKTATLHADAWKKTFDEYLKFREKRDKEPFHEFTYEHDYLSFVDGKPRYLGVKSFLESRNIFIPFGETSDPPDKETVCGIGNRKNLIFNQLLLEEKVEVYHSTIKFIEALKEQGIKVGVASSSKNCKQILKSRNLENLFETIVNGIVSEELKFKGKPEGDIFVTAAKNLGATPELSVVVEDATSGVEAGRNAGFGLVVGIARKNNENELFNHGADIVVPDLSEISIEILNEWFQRKPKSFFECYETIDRESEILSKNYTKDKKIQTNPYYDRTGKSILNTDKKHIFFLDYDGTLTPIVESPELAKISKDMKKKIEDLSNICTVAIVSGRMRENVQDLVGIKDIFYAGSHGFDIQGPKLSMIHPLAKKAIPTIANITRQLKTKLSSIDGVLIEEKRFSVAVHYRKISRSEDISFVQKTVKDLIQKCQQLKLLKGKKVFEILPDVDWDKGKAIRWIINALKIPWETSSVFYIGDDTTDEYAFRTIVTRGTAIIVTDDPQKSSSADFRLESPEEVKKFFEKVIAISKK